MGSFGDPLEPVGGGQDPGQEAPHQTQDLLVLAQKALRMAAGLREHVVAGRLLDAWAAADWLEDLAGEVKAALPVTAQDIVAAVEGHQPEAAAKVGRALIQSGAVPWETTEEEVSAALLSEDLAAADRAIIERMTPWPPGGPQEANLRAAVQAALGDLRPLGDLPVQGPRQRWRFPPSEPYPGQDQP